MLKIGLPTVSNHPLATAHFTTILISDPSSLKRRKTSLIGCHMARFPCVSM
jgi:hypothetical protein